jgi:hypothetical protein
MSAVRSGMLAIVLLGISGCAQTGSPPAIGLAPVAQRETIAWSAGPCFGFCPVYKVSVTPSGTITFDGERHTAVVGRKVREGGPEAYRIITEALEPYRPAVGTTAQTQCDQQMTDLSAYVVTWAREDGTITTLQHDKGCRSLRNDALNAALQALPDRLQIEGWTAQLTRPGTSRG